MSTTKDTEIKLPKIGSKVRVWGRGGISSTLKTVVGIEKAPSKDISQFPLVIVSGRLINKQPVELICIYAKKPSLKPGRRLQVLNIRYVLKYPNSIKP